jgi:bifunctional DNase/RNase
MLKPTAGFGVARISLTTRVPASHKGSREVSLNPNMPEEFEGSEQPENLDEPPPFFPYEGNGSEREPGALGELVEVQIEGVFAAESQGSISRFVLVTDGERRLPILIGPYEAQAISLPLEGTRPDRPMTHDLIRNILDRLELFVERVVIDDLWNTIYYAKVYLRKGEEEIEIDARPSDAIALAVRFDAPIYVSDGILDTGIEE